MTDRRSDDSTLPWAAPAVAVAAALGAAPAIAGLASAAADPGAALNALASPALWDRFARTLAHCGAAVVAGLPAGMLLGWALARLDIPFRRTLQVACLLPLFVPPLVHAIAWERVAGLRGVAGVVLVHAAGTTLFTAATTMRALSRVSRSHAETMTLLGGPLLVLRDDLRHARPAAIAGAAVAAALQMSDFAVADFLSAVGPKVTSYADSMLALHAAGDEAGAAASAVPGAAATVVLLLLAFRLGAREGETVSSAHAAAPPVDIGRARVPVACAAAAAAGAAAIFPLSALAVAAAPSFLRTVGEASGTIARTVALGLLVAALSLAVAAPLAAWRRDSSRPRLLDLLVAVPVAVPAALAGIGYVRMWNRPGLDALYLGIGGAACALAGRYLVLAYTPAAWASERLGRGVFEAAQLGGAGPARRFVSVFVPLTAPQLVGAACLALCFALRELDALVMLRGAHDTLTYRLHRSVIFAPEGELASLALLSALATMAPMAVVHVAASRRGCAR